MATAEATMNIRRNRRAVSNATWCPTTGATRSPWRAARGRTCGMPRATRYLDFFPGWGCNLLGHCPAPVVEAVQEQVATLIHVPNTWYTEAQGRWAKLLSERSFGGQAFFCNSGTEANEAAIKLARLHTPKPRYKIITFEGGFHGRTLGATAATAQPKYHEGLRPADGRLRLRAVRRSGGGRAADRRRDRRDHDRAGPGRRGRQHSARRLSGRLAANWPTNTTCC